MLYLYISGTVILTVYGQLILKWRINQLPQMPELFSDKLLYLFKLVIDPYIFSGLFAGFLASLFWMAAMTKADLSFAYPFITAGLTFLTVFSAILIFGEPISWLKSLGILLVLLGVITIAYSNS